MGVDDSDNVDNSHSDNSENDDHDHDDAGKNERKDLETLRNKTEQSEAPDEIKKLFAQHIPKKTMELMTVHLMGTCGMGGDPTRHVCDPYGKVYDTEGLYVADASLLPGAVGVNPMETIMALATRNVHRLIDNNLNQRRSVA